MEVAAGDRQVRAEYLRQILGDPVVRRRGRRQQTEVGRQGPDGPLDEPVVGTEIVTPVRDAMGFVDHQQRDAIRHFCEHAVPEPLIGETFRSDQEDIHFVGPERVLDFAPSRQVVGVDRLGLDSHPARGGNLIAHEREQRADQQSGALPGFAQHLRGDEVNEALAPAGLLNDEQPPGTRHDVADRLRLTRAELSTAFGNALAQQGEGAVLVEFRHGGPETLNRLRDSLPGLLDHEIDDRNQGFLVSVPLQATQAIVVDLAVRAAAFADDREHVA